MPRPRPSAGAEAQPSGAFWPGAPKAKSWLLFKSSFSQIGGMLHVLRANFLCTSASAQPESIPSRGGVGNRTPRIMIPWRLAFASVCVQFPTRAQPSPRGIPDFSVMQVRVGEDRGMGGFFYIFTSMYIIPKKRSPHNTASPRLS